MQRSQLGVRWSSYLMLKKPLVKTRPPSYWEIQVKIHAVWSHCSALTTCNVADGRCRRGRFQGSAGWKLLDRSTPNLSQVMTILTTGEGTRSLQMKLGCFNFCVLCLFLFPLPRARQRLPIKTVQTTRSKIMICSMRFRLYKFVLVWTFVGEYNQNSLPMQRTITSILQTTRTMHAIWVNEPTVTCRTVEFYYKGQKQQKRGVCAIKNWTKEPILMINVDSSFSKPQSSDHPNFVSGETKRRK